MLLTKNLGSCCCCCLVGTVNLLVKKKVQDITMRILSTQLDYNTDLVLAKIFAEVLRYARYYIHENLALTRCIT